jgi:periplasmic protein TonB
MARTNAVYSGYGAFELKATYQRNMLMGALFAAALVIVAILGAYIYRALTEVEAASDRIQIIKTIADLGPPPTVSKKPPRIDIAQPNLVAPKVGIPKPVADEDAIDMDVTIATKEQIANIVQPQVEVSDDAVNAQIKVEIPDDEYMPAPDEFVPTEIPAEMISEATPEYPRLAKQAGLEAVVWVKALVDKNGDVKKAMIYKSSGSKAGFDEMAVEAAYKCKFKPAVQNGRPVAVWVAYSVEFSLTESPR